MSHAWSSSHSGVRARGAAPVVGFDVRAAIAMRAGTALTVHGEIPVAAENEALALRLPPEQL